MKTRNTHAKLVALGAALLLATPLLAGVKKVDRPVPGQYIVILKANAARGPADPAASGPAVGDVASSLARQHRGRLGRVFQHAVKGFVVDASELDAESLAADPRVAYVVEDGVVQASGVQLDPPSWGLDRVDQEALPLDGKYVYYGDGTGVNLYIIDSGVLSTHSDFTGRVDTVNAFTAIDDGLGIEDCAGHGTMVAGVAAGATYGVAKGATIHPVRVLDCNASGQVSGVIAGIDWVTANHQSPAVANLSVATGANQALDDAVTNSIADGVVYTVAAGNGAVPACDLSPGRVYQALTVGASDAADQRAAFSNYGYCVDLFAPGTNITSAWIGSDDASMTGDGTSFSAPAVAGTAALYLEQNPSASVDEVTWAIINSASHAVADDGTGSTDLLLYSAFVGEGIDQPPYPALSFSCSGRRCQFDGSGSADDHGIVMFSWDFGDGTVVSGKKKKKVGHRFPKVGDVFTVTLTVTDTIGQPSMLQQEVRFSY